MVVTEILADYLRTERGLGWQLSRNRPKCQPQARCTFEIVSDDFSDYWGCPKCGNLTLRLEDKNGRCDVATCEYDKCDYFDEGVPE